MIFRQVRAQPFASNDIAVLVAMAVAVRTTCACSLFTIQVTIPFIVGRMSFSCDGIFAILLRSSKIAPGIARFVVQLSFPCGLLLLGLLLVVGRKGSSFRKGRGVVAAGGGGGAKKSSSGRSCLVHTHICFGVWFS